MFSILETNCMKVADEASVLCSVFCKIDIDLFIYHVQLAQRTLFALQIDGCNI